MDVMWAPWRMSYIMGDEEEIKGCIFCELPKWKDDSKSLIVHRSEYCYVILNRYPYNNGHVMIVPNRHTHDFTALTEKELLDCQNVIQKTVKAFRKVYNPDAMNMGMNMGRPAGAGIEEHLHYHLLPRWNGDTNFMPVISGTKVISEALEQSYEKLSTALKEV